MTHSETSDRDLPVQVVDELRVEELREQERSASAQAKRELAQKNDGNSPWFSGLVAIFLTGWILALVVSWLFGARALYCASGAAQFQACMQSGMVEVIGVGLLAGALIVTVWALGHVEVVTIFIALVALFHWLVAVAALSALLLWLGILPR